MLRYRPSRSKRASAIQYCMCTSPKYYDMATTASCPSSLPSTTQTSASRSTQGGLDTEHSSHRRIPVFGASLPAPEARLRDESRAACVHVRPFAPHESIEDSSRRPYQLQHGQGMNGSKNSFSNCLPICVKVNHVARLASNRPSLVLSQQTSPDSPGSLAPWPRASRVPHEKPAGRAVAVLTSQKRPKPRHVPRRPPVQQTTASQAM